MYTLTPEFIASQQDTSSKNSNKMLDTSFIGAIAGAIPQVTAQFNGKYQENQLAIAEANARAAQANSSRLFNGGNSENPNSKNYTYLAIGLVAVVALYFILKK